MNKPKWVIGLGEYNCFLLNNNQIYDVSPGLPTKVAGQPSVVTNVAAGLHHFGLIDNNGNVFAWGDNTWGMAGNGTSGNTIANPSQIVRDINGNSFTNVKKVVPYCNGQGSNGEANGFIALKNDGTVWVWGNTQLGMRGDGSAGNNVDPYPFQVPELANIVDVGAGYWFTALDASGQVWTWGAASLYLNQFMLGQGTNTPSTNTPAKVAQPNPATQIAQSDYASYALLTDGSLLAWGAYPGYYGFEASGNPSLTPVLLDKIFNFQAPIAKIAVGHESSYALLQDGTLWAWGDNACGTIGNGVELNFATYKGANGSTPYAWDWGRSELPQQFPVQIGIGVSFVNILATNVDSFYAYAEDINGNLYSWGRNKGSVLGNGVVAADTVIAALPAVYPNSWDVPYVTLINPFALKSTVLTTSPICITNTSAPYCPKITPGPTAVANAGPNQNLVSSGTTNATQLNGSATGSPVNYWLWTQISGPNHALIVLPTSQNPVVQNLEVGQYVFQLQTTDNEWRNSTSTVAVNITAPLPPPPPPPTKRTIVSVIVNFSDGTSETITA